MDVRHRKGLILIGSHGLKNKQIKLGSVHPGKENGNGFLICFFLGGGAGIFMHID